MAEFMVDPDVVYAKIGIIQRCLRRIKEITDLDPDTAHHLLFARNELDMISDSTRRWIERVEYDMHTAEAMLDTGRLIYAVFMCQQAIEKCFKALLAHEEDEIFPIHNLRRLAEQCRVIEELNDDQLINLDFLSQYYINARYKEDIAELSRGITKEFSRNFVYFSKEIIQWLSQKMK